MPSEFIKNTIGYYGKIPSKGDFIYNDFNLDFIYHWNEWMESIITVSKEQLEGNWLDCYLTSPIWHFSLSEGVCCENAIFGSIIPSIDKKSRYFPFSIVKSHHATAVQAWSKNSWDLEFEKIILEVLEDDFDLLKWDNKLQFLPKWFDPIVSYYNEVKENNTHNTMLIMGLETDNIETLLDQQYKLRFQSYSLWWTRGSDLVAPSLIITEGLPPVNLFSSMLDGHWKDRNWNISENI
ncbi:MAG: type VI secretion system-associated protein TagF [Psychromonas sp.]|nr:type VI secretion system-associated protein TagF [Psychromonas sp.]